MTASIAFQFPAKTLGKTISYVIANKPDIFVKYSLIILIMFASSDLLVGRTRQINILGIIHSFIHPSMVESAR